MNSAIIVAGGIGSRIGGKIPKQFLKLNGKEILSYSVNTFINHSEINEVIIVSHPDWYNIVSSKYPLCNIVKGGERRQDSSLNGVKATSDNTENVLIHDAARPFISSKIISQCIETLNEYDGTAPIMDVNNSMVYLENDHITSIDRSKVREVQTPQCFKKKLIMDILSSNTQGTDEIGMLIKEKPNASIKFVNGSRKNRKITSKIDLELIKKLSN